MSGQPQNIVSEMQGLPKKFDYKPRKNLKKERPSFPPFKQNETSEPIRVYTVLPNFGITFSTLSIASIFKRAEEVSNTKS